jgi:KUP system potassium uptake protein
LGIVFGDIGTSPLYVLKAILSSSSHIDELLIIGSLSCIIWTLTLQTTIKYVVITLKADNKGEGGILSLFALLRKKHSKLFVFALIGGSTLLADGVITPSITVMSAIEGVSIMNPMIPVYSHRLLIITGFFFIQQFGNSFRRKIVWPHHVSLVLMLGVLGLTQLLQKPNCF